MKFSLRLLFIFFLAIAPDARIAVAGESVGAAQPRLPVVTLRIGSTSVTAEVADDPAEQEKGLMFRETLADGEGMLFVMERPGPAAFWMKNTKLPLSIAYIDPEGVIAEIHDLEPFNERAVPSVFPRVAFALEVPQGWFARKNIWPGERIQGLPKPAAARR